MYETQKHVPIYIFIHICILCEYVHTCKIVEFEEGLHFNK